MKSITKVYPRETLALFWQHACRYPGALTVFAVGSFVAVGTDIVQPILNQGMIDTAFSHDSFHEHSARWYMWASVVVAIIHHACWRIMGLMNSRFQPRVMSDLYNTCFGYLIGHSLNFFADNLVGSISSRMKRMPAAFGTIDDRFKWNINVSLLHAIAVIAVIFHKLGNIGFLFVAWFALFSTVGYIAARIKLKPDLATSEQDSTVSGLSSDVYTNISTVQLYSGEREESVRFVQETEELYVRRSRSLVVGESIQLVQGVLMVVLRLAVLDWSLRAARAGEYTPGEITMLLMYFWQLSQHMWDFGNNIKDIFESIATGSEMTQMLKAPHDVVDVPCAAPLHVRDGRITFKNVTFGYQPGKAVLRNLNLEIMPGQQVALVGFSGAGKTTLVELLLRNQNVTSGKILIDDQDIALATKGSVRNAISYVAQSPTLFHRSLAANIAYGKPGATMAEIQEAARLAHLHEYILTCEHGYDTVVGERGVKLSGGQRQRASIARAILKDAPIVILDEATSALDSESEMHIQDSMRSLMAGKTRLVIAHRLSTIRESNLIVVLDKGQIAEFGTHDELLQIENGIYRTLWEKQVGGFVTGGSPTE